MAGLPAAGVWADDELPPVVVTSGEVKPVEQESLAVLLGAGDVRNLLRVEPNANAGGAPGSLFSLRGVSQEGTLTPGNRTNVGLTVQEGKFPRSTNSLWAFGMPSWDMQELAVDYGPKLFGQGPAAPGGEVRLEPRVPEFSETGRLLGEIGGQGTYRSGATLNSVLVPDRVAVRINVLADGNDGAISNVANGDDEFAASDRILLRGQVRWRPAGDDTTVVDALVERTEMRGNILGLAGMRPNFRLFERKVNLNGPEQVPADHFGVSLGVTSQLDGGQTLEVWTSLQLADGYNLVDFDSTPVLNWWYRNMAEEERATGGFQLRQEGDRGAFLVGGYVDSADYALNFRGRGLSNDAAGLPFASLVDESVQMGAVYFRGEVDWGGGWRGFSGVRLDSQRRKVAMDVDYPSGVSQEEERANSLELLPELGVDWQRDGRTLGVRLSRAYRPAGVGYAFTLGQAEPYGAERGWEIEGHGEIQRQTTRLGARVFFATVDDQQLPTIVAGGIPALDQWIINAGASTRYGSELDCTWDGPGELHTRIFGGWLATTFDELDDFGLGGSNTAFPNAPEWNAGIVAAWTPRAGWFAESAMTWQDCTYAQFGSPKTTKLEPRLELSSRLGFRWRNSEAYLFGTNLLDEDFALVRRDFGASGRSVQGRPSMPRVLGIGWELSW